MKNRYLLLILTTLIIACTPKTPGAIQIDLSKADNVTLDELGLKAEMQLLKFPNDSEFIGTIDKIDISDKYIHAIERESQNIFQFDRNTGEFIRKIDKTGRAGDEYLYITDIRFRNDKLYVSDPNQDKVIVYDQELKHIENIPGRIPILNFISDDHLLIHAGPFNIGDAEFIKTNLQNDTISKWCIRTVPNNKNIPMVQPTSQKRAFTYNNELYLSPMYSRELFKVVNDTLSKFLEFDFGSDNMPERLKYEFVSKIYESPAAIPKDIYSLGDLLIFTVEMGSITSPITASEDYYQISINDEYRGEKKSVYIITYNFRSGKVNYGRITATAGIEFSPATNANSNTMMQIHSIIEPDIEPYRPYLTNIATSDKLQDGDIILVYYTAK